MCCQGYLGRTTPVYGCTSFDPDPHHDPCCKWTLVDGIPPVTIAPDGSVECWSDNGHDCVWGANYAALIASNTELKQPLVCFCDQYIGTHWCNIGKAALGAHPPNEGCKSKPILALNLAAGNTADTPNNALLVFVSTVTGAGLALAVVALNNYRRRIPSTQEERQIIL
ncbi:Aste57867_1300 [Aphanomyces stellatus]|uniref:Aste57867_1300 protein n=1 Tax=Aphanomyces stellatus TaxID=120398 RepID=A0A485K5A2_9STRA|nr:hypothetical protein As57867_001299 [Aphanomyces stellatus]VFT78519.1 Aste57867_1300 [Aphanomyces stellatus]